MQPAKQLIKMDNITKTFPGVIALDNVKIDLKAGEVHALMGENGAGKSTLMKIIAGVYKQDKGKYYLDGKEIMFDFPREAQLNGISIIYQELNLIPDLSIAENIFLGREPSKRPGKIDWTRMYEDTTEILNELGINLDPAEKIKNISIANKQMVEIAKALSFNSKIIIMDEPTSALEDDEIEYLFKIINDLKEKNVGIFYISHKMDEIFRISDRITVFRDGQHIKTMAVSETNMDELIRLMVGREIKNIFPEREVEPVNETVMEVNNLTVINQIENISFAVEKGEILGIAGLMGCGKIDVGKAIFGCYPDTTGEILINNEVRKINSPHDAIKYKIALVSEDRKNGGLVLDRNVKENIMLSSLSQISGLLKLNHKKEKKVVKEAVKNLNIKVSNVEQPSKTLSGGNQQKVVIAKWLETKPEILILLEATRGIDIGSKTEIYELITTLAENGISILYISSELTELVGLCDRVLVMHEGKLSGVVSGNDINQEKIMYLSSGGTLNVG
ncbi:sugar ABC transporter ATP-binding protein [Halocella sp. SP3-1]|uniref:sugar ABC transporter ATP-binding protein n=1 Tax=Halocella sp. SP3-1 TaxID=2382161 RepID=UPI000F74FB9D|nr:sugar ABC transporter ATP-binding protein [Halocella sp. SP3-1]AZO93869.1 sugar ABC transporter ATP-binding protein [Halocella sp. SP3-1]